MNQNRMQEMLNAEVKDPTPNPLSEFIAELPDDGALDWKGIHQLLAVLVESVHNGNPFVIEMPVILRTRVPLRGKTEHEVPAAKIPEFLLALHQYGKEYGKDLSFSVPREVIQSARDYLSEHLMGVAQRGQQIQ